MDLVVGFLRIILAYTLARAYRMFRFEPIGRQIIRLCCAAFIAGAGLDDAAIDVLRILGDDGIRLLKNEANRPSEAKRSERVDAHAFLCNIPLLMLTMLRPETDV